jgi:hypothetical protein
MEEFEFESMTKLESKLSVSIYGPSGSGKTTAAIKLAMGIRDQLYPGQSLEDIALFVDTEKKSSSKIVGRTVGGEAVESMQVYHFEAPYDIYKFASLVEHAVSKGKKIIVTDSFTHFWSGKDGILENVADLEIQLANSKKLYGAWSEKEIIAKKNVLKGIVSNSKVHLIFCYRAKTEYEVDKIGGKTSIKVIGVKEDMQGDVPYEHDIVFSLDRDTHEAAIMKDRLGFQEFRMTKENPNSPLASTDGKELARIASEGISLEELAQYKKNKLISFILSEKASKSTKVAMLEESKKIVIDEELLKGMSHDNLVKIVNIIK